MRPRIIPVPGPASSRVLDNANGRLVFWAFRETSGVNSATFRLWDGSNNGGAEMLPITLVANESIREAPGLQTLPYRVGLFLEVLSGTVEGSVTVLPWPKDDGEWGLPVFVIGSVDLTFNEFAGGG